MIKKTFFPAFIWLLAITGVSMMPGGSMPKFNIISADKFGHAFVYAVLTWLILRGISLKNSRSTTAKEIAVTLLFAAGYGVLMEFVQYTFIPGRVYEYDDMLANTFGALLGWLVFHLFSKRKS